MPIYRSLEPYLSRIRNVQVARRIRMQFRLAIAASMIAFALAVADWIFSLPYDGSWAVFCGFAFLLSPYLIRWLTPRQTRLFFVTLANVSMFTLAMTLPSRSILHYLIIVNFSLPALLFEQDDIVSNFIGIGETVFIFTLNYLTPGVAVELQIPSLPLHIYADILGFFFVYFGVRYFEKRDMMSEAAIRNLVDALPDVVLTLDRKGYHLSCHVPPTIPSQSILHNIVGMHYREVLPADVTAQMDAAWKALLETGEPQTFSYRLNPYPDFKEKFLEARLVLSGRDEVVSIVQDQTARVMSERASRKNEEQFRQIVETTHEGIWNLDESATTTFVNDRLCAMLGYSAPELIGKSPFDFVAPDFKEVLARELMLRRTGVSNSYDCKFLRKDGAVLWTLISGSPMRDENGEIRGTIGMLVDITERKRMEAEIISSSKMSALGVMSSGIAHEINNPLTVIHGRANQLKQLASSGQPIDPRTVAQYAEKIQATAIRISNIVKALRSFSRDTNEDPFENHCANAILADTLELCKERFREHGITLEVHEASENRMLKCRPAEVSQIILNLLNNAHDAVQALDEKWVKVALREHEHELEISVTDSGKGIPMDIRERILQPFFTTKDVGKGTGLGLSVSKGLAESHGGRLYLDHDSPNTRFVLVLPNQSADATVLAT